MTADRPKMRLLECRRIENAGALVWRVKVLLPCGLEIGDIAIFAKNGRAWAQLPSQPLRDRAGQPIAGADGRAKYVSPLRWESRDLQDRFSEAVIALIEAEHATIGGLQ